ncbi:MAG: Xaa-Pro peptidase family protein [Alphaproteobacteria bacterium]
MKTKAPAPTARLLYSCDADWFYATNMPMSDAALWYQDTAGKTHILASDRDMAEAKHKAQVDKIHPFPKDAKTVMAQIMWLIGQEKKAPKVVEVPANFPAFLFAELTVQGVPLTPVKGSFFKAREVKTKAEIAAIRASQHLNQNGFLRLEKILRESDIARDGSIIWQGEPLTSEHLQAEMKLQNVRDGATSFNGGPICAGGAHSAHPHERGHGVLKADHFIIVDSFPTYANNYVGDLTRTYVKGKADAWHRDVYGAVLAAQELALGTLKAGVNGVEVHKAVAAYFEKNGFPAGKDKKGEPFGFFHGTGHGVGLEVHDIPSGTLSLRGVTLQAGHITSVEPGLYYPGKGGCRIEDIVAITKTGYDNLTTLPKNNWVID